MKIKKHNIPAIVDPSQICRALVGLKGIEILFYRRQGSFAEIAIQQTIGELFCKSCGSRAYVKDRPWVSYVDLPFGGTPTRVLWKKHRMICRNNDCETKTWTLGDHRISAVGCFLTTRAANLTNSAWISLKQTINPWWNARYPTGLKMPHPAKRGRAL